MELKNSFKIVAVDNFNRELVADYLVADNVLSEREGRVMVDALNGKDWGQVCYRLVPDTYELYEFKG